MEEKNRKKKLVNQAERLGYHFNSWDDEKKLSECSIDELEQIIRNILTIERNRIHDFLNFEYLDKVKQLHQLMINSKYTKINYNSLFDFYDNVRNLLYDYDSTRNYSHHGDISYFTASVTIGDTLVEYKWARMTGGEGCIWDEGGFTMNQVWKSMKFIKKEDTVTVTKILEWIEENEFPTNIKMSIREYVSRQIIN